MKRPPCLSSPRAYLWTKALEWRSKRRVSHSSRVRPPYRCPVVPLQGDPYAVAVLCRLRDLPDGL